MFLIELSYLLRKKKLVISQLEFYMFAIIPKPGSILTNFARVHKKVLCDLNLIISYVIWKLQKIIFYSLHLVYFRKVLFNTLYTDNNVVFFRYPVNTRWKIVLLKNKFKSTAEHQFKLSDCDIDSVSWRPSDSNKEWWETSNLPSKYDREKKVLRLKEH